MPPLYRWRSWMRLREIESPVQAHLAGKWQSQDLKPDGLDSKASMVFASPKAFKPTPGSGLNFWPEWMCRNRKRGGQGKERWGSAFLPVLTQASSCQSLLTTIPKPPPPPLTPCLRSLESPPVCSSMPTTAARRVAQHLDFRQKIYLRTR